MVSGSQPSVRFVPLWIFGMKEGEAETTLPRAFDAIIYTNGSVVLKFLAFLFTKSFVGEILRVGHSGVWIRGCWTAEGTRVEQTSLEIILLGDQNNILNAKFDNY